jgi:plastocyanin
MIIVINARCAMSIHTPSASVAREFARVIGALALALGVAACGSSGATPAASAAATSGAGGAAGTTVVKMTDKLTFDPANITVKVGSTVRWENDSSIQHSTVGRFRKGADAGRRKAPGRRPGLGFRAAFPRSNL